MIKLDLVIILVSNVSVQKFILPLSENDVIDKNKFQQECSRKLFTMKFSRFKYDSLAQDDSDWIADSLIRSVLSLKRAL